MQGHDQFADQAAAYALGALTPAERVLFEAHAATCAECAAQVRAFGQVAVGLAHLAPPADPPRAVRGRIMLAIQPSTTSEKPARPPTQVAFSVFRGLCAYQVQLTATQAQRTTSVIEAPDVIEVVLEGEPAAPQASGLAFISPARGIVFVATKMPPLAAGSAYQVWLLARDARPVSVGLVHPDASGQIAVTLAMPAQTPAPAAIVVTLEPDGGSPVPGGSAHLIGTTP